MDERMRCSGSRRYDETQLKALRVAGIGKFDCYLVTSFE